MIKYRFLIYKRIGLRAFASVSRERGFWEVFPGFPKVFQGRSSQKGLPRRSEGFPRRARSLPSRPQGLPRSPQGLSEARLAKVSTKALPLRPGFSKMSTKALPQAFRRLIFRSGCSIVLFSNLKVVSFWVRLSDCPVMAGLSKRFIQTFLPSGSCRQLLLEASSFFVHCTKAL